MRTKHTPEPKISDRKIELLYDPGLQKVSDRPAFGLYVKGYVSSPIGLVEFYLGRAVADQWASRIQDSVSALPGVEEPEKAIQDARDTISQAIAHVKEIDQPKGEVSRRYRDLMLSNWSDALKGLGGGS